MIKRSLATLALANLGWSPAIAQDATAIASPAAVAEVLQNEGYRAKLTTQDDRAEIESGATGVKFWVDFYDCTADFAMCDTALFYSSFTSDFDDLEAVNAWNRDNFSKAYLDEQRNPVLEYTFDIKGGVAEANVTAALDNWVDELTNFLEAIGWGDDDEQAPEAESGASL